MDSQGRKVEGSTSPGAREEAEGSTGERGEVLGPTVPGWLPPDPIPQKLNSWKRIDPLVSSVPSRH